MTLWAPIMTSLRDHRKAAEAGDRAMWLYVCMHLFCKERDTNGRVSVHELKTLNAQRGKEALTLRLVDVGLLESFDGGWKIVKYDEKGPKAAEKAALRESWREQKKAQRQGNVSDKSEIRVEQSKEEKRREENTHVSSMASVSDSSSSLHKPPSSRARDFAEAVEDLWTEWPSNRRPISAIRAAELLEAQGVTTADEVRTLIDRMREDSDSRDWREGVIPRLDNWITNRNWDRPVVTKIEQFAKSEHPADRAVARFLEGAQ